ncbi:MAG: DNA polymerase III subunit delta, partial [Cellvibrionaceae bacterium]|nr:DNA polymerase III subunit delta [Cellvibrionaceae bacterium]
MAKLRYEQLQRQLQQGLAIAYLISGDETLLVQEACDLIRQHAKQRGFKEREIFHADKQFDWSHLFQASQSLSLFSDKKLLELRIGNGKPGDKGSKAINDYVADASPDNCLLIITPKLDSSSQRSKWVKAVEKQGHWLPIWPISAAQLPQWLAQRLRSKGLHADSQSIDLLAARTEGNLLAAHQEVEKLALLTEDAYLSPELIARSVADNARYDIFGLIDTALHGDGRKAAATLQGLRREGTEATLVLWGLARTWRQEQPDWPLVLVDLEPGAGETDLPDGLLRCLADGPDESE